MSECLLTDVCKAAREELQTPMELKSPVRRQDYPQIMTYRHSRTRLVFGQILVRFLSQ